MASAELSLAARMRIDDVCDQFEHQWISGQEPDLPTYVDNFSGKERAFVLRELVILDLAYRWQSAATDSQVESVAQQLPNDGTSCGRSLPTRPLVEDYLACFPELGSSSEVPLELIQEELRVRIAFGDRPSAQSYYDRFPQRTDLNLLLGQFETPRPVVTTHDSPVEAGPVPSNTPSGAVGRFQILRLLESGGLGRVSVARDSELNRQVAVKELKEQIADNPAYRARFIMEAEITGRLEHPGIVPVYGFGQDNNNRPCE